MKYNDPHHSVRSVTFLLFLVISQFFLQQVLRIHSGAPFFFCAKCLFRVLDCKIKHRQNWQVKSHCPKTLTATTTTTTTAELKLAFPKNPSQPIEGNSLLKKKWPFFLMFSLRILQWCSDNFSNMAHLIWNPNKNYKNVHLNSDGRNEKGWNELLFCTKFTTLCQKIYIKTSVWNKREMIKRKKAKNELF